MIEQNVIQFETSKSAIALGNAWASLSAGTTRQIIGFSGGASAAGSTVRLFIGKILKYTQFQSPSGGAVQEWFGILGPVTTSSIAVNTRTFNSNAQHCSANLLYRIVL